MFSSYVATLPGMACSLGLVLSWPGGILSQSAPSFRNYSVRLFAVVVGIGLAFLV